MSRLISAGMYGIISLAYIVCTGISITLHMRVLSACSESAVLICCRLVLFMKTDNDDSPRPLLFKQAYSFQPHHAMDFCGFLVWEVLLFNV